MSTNTAQFLSLYLHIPFCRTMCSYCAFNTYTDLDELIPDFVKALEREVRILGNSNPGYPVHTIFFGGGTPSLLRPEHYVKLMSAINDSFRVVSEAEISIETNPNDLSEDYLRGIRQTGINRLSIGMQSATPQVLELFHRRHDQKAVSSAVMSARRAGFENISLDLIFGAPHQALEDWKTTLDTALKLDVEHFSTYGLELKGGTVLTEQVESGSVPRPDDDLAADMYDWTTEAMGSAGYAQYELSNWCKPGFEARHNIQYWRIHPYLGLGPGAHGYVNR
ncbi:MAG: radical SAM family heme chaperone HemW, partial [Anaerolineae bacterium]|nr:radical SAM family heme chaperone HemW [Anaerolineae bacterium]